MIKRLKYHEIDFEKYSECLENSAQQNFYAQKHILDFLCETWELLVFKNYEAVMPVPIKQKLGFSFALQPLFCQQLGVFSNEDNPLVNDIFFNFLKKNYRTVYYGFNAENQFTSKVLVKKNHVIDRQSYQNLRKKYFKGRKYSIKSAQFHTFKELELNDENIHFIRSNFKGLKKEGDKAKLMSYLHFLNKNNQLKIFGCFNNLKLTNAAIAIKTEEKLFLLALVNDPKFIKYNGASFLIDKILQENIEHRDFDFMGSNLSGIGLFFKSFGASERVYGILETSKKDLLLSLFT